METQVHPGGARPGDRPHAQLRLYLLGRFEVVRAGAPIPAHAWRRRRPADLLKLVALAPGRTLTREQAVEALWPEKDASSGANNLHRALYDLRQVLGGRFVDIERGRLRLRSDVWIDVDAFDRAVRAGGREAFTQAVALYRGDLAPDDHDAPWVVARRAALRGRFVEAALPLARAAAADGDAQLAGPLLRRVLEIEPALEEVHRLLMRLLAGTGRRAEALRQHDACEAALHASGIAPTGELRALRAAIQAGEVGPSKPRAALDGFRRAARRLLGTTEPAPVRGRSAILLLVESLVEQGAGALVLLGERGAGKTRLALEGARLAQARGAAVVCGIGGVAPGVPYGLFQDALREEARVNPAVADPLACAPRAAGTAPADVRRAIFAGVEQALRSAAAGRPLFLLVDELHLADESSLNLVHLLARDARELRLMIAATCSEEAIHAGTPIQLALAHLDCGRLARGVRVPRLGLAGTREQVSDLLGAPAADGLVAQIYRSTDGSPLLVEEVVRAFQESGEARVPDDPAAAIRARAARLGPRAETLLAAAAVAGARFDVETVRAVTDLTAHEAIVALEAALGARLVDEDAAGHHFHHALVRDAIYEGLAPERRAALHAALADALEACAGGEPPSEALALHHRRAGQDDRALRHLVAAGHRAAARAGLREALAFYEEALEIAREPGAAGAPLQHELLDASGRVQLELGELAGAARAFADAARLCAGGWRPGAPLRARAHRLAAVALAAGGHVERAHAELDAGVAAAHEAGGDGLAALLHLRAQLLWHEERHPDAAEAARACREAAEHAGDVELAVRGGDLAVLARAARGEPEVAEPPAPGCAERRRQDATPEHPLDVHLCLWERDLLVPGGVSSVTRLASILGARARVRGAPEALATARSGEGAAALAAGRLDLAEAALRDALAGHRAAGSALGEALALERLAALLTQRGAFDEARSLLDEGVVVAERGALRRHALTRLHATEARNRLAAGSLHAAEDAVREASEAAARHGECLACDAAFRPEAVRVLVARGRLDEAEREAAQLEAIARRRGGAVPGAIALAARGRVLAAAGRAAEALAALGRAREAFLLAGHRAEAARCARLEVRLLGPGASLADEVRALDALVTVDADA